MSYMSEHQYMKNATDIIRLIRAIKVDCLERKYWIRSELRQSHEGSMQNAKAQKS